jgi:hypothetical protein
MSRPPTIHIDWIGGNCPVQAEGTINDKPFYFRARGEHWSLGIGIDPIGDPEWEHAEWYGEWPDAGWMPVEEAEAFLRHAAACYAEGLPGAQLKDCPDRMTKLKTRLDTLYGRKAT